MRCLLLYFTGTFHTRFLTEKVSAALKEKGFDVECVEISPNKIETFDARGYDLVGLGYPIYAFNAPKPFLSFVRKARFAPGQNVFFYKDSGEPWFWNDASSLGLIHSLKRKKARILGEYHFLFPYNIHFRFEDDIVRKLLAIDRKLLSIMIEDLSKGKPKKIRIPFMARLAHYLLRVQFLGGFVNSFFYRVDKGRCISCEACVSLCPMGNISLDKKGHIRFGHRCVMCMRCSFLCPKDAIRIGMLDSWRVNGAYPLTQLEKEEAQPGTLKEVKKGFFRDHERWIKDVEKRYAETVQNPGYPSL